VGASEVALALATVADAIVNGVPDTDADAHDAAAADPENDGADPAAKRCTSIQCTTAFAPPFYAPPPLSTQRQQQRPPAPRSGPRPPGPLVRRDARVRGGGGGAGGVRRRPPRGEGGSQPGERFFRAVPCPEKNIRAVLSYRCAPLTLLSPSPPSPSPSPCCRFRCASRPWRPSWPCATPQPTATASPPWASSPASEPSCAAAPSSGLIRRVVVVMAARAARGKVRRRSAMRPRRSPRWLRGCATLFRWE